MSKPPSLSEKEIPLTCGLVALVDEADFDWLSQWKWRVNAGKYAVRSVYAGRGHGGRYHSLVHMHREILGAPPGLEIDHIDRNGFNNTRANLRICTKAQNQMNRVKFPGKLSRFKGVSLQKAGWIARIGTGGKVYLGHFRTPEEAARAYDVAAVSLYGDFAVLNLPGATP